MVVRPYEEHQNIPDIFADFLGAIGVPDSPAFVRPGTVNASLAPAVVAAIRAVRNSTLLESEKTWMTDRLSEFGTRTKPRVRYLSPGQRSAVLEPYHQSYRQIAEEFMGRPGEYLFTEQLPDPDPLSDGTLEVGPDEILDAVLKAAARSTV
jgi:hypothetical protein